MRCQRAVDNAVLATTNVQQSTRRLTQFAVAQPQFRHTASEQVAIRIAESATLKEHVGTIQDDAIDQSVNIGMNKGTAFRRILDQHRTPLRRQIVVRQVGEEIICSVATDDDGILQRTSANQSTCHPDAGFVVQVDSYARVDGQGHSLLDDEAVHDLFVQL